MASTDAIAPSVYPSRIERVVLHARGARITRRVDVSNHTSSGIIRVQGITPLAQSNSFRASIESADVELISMQSTLHIPRDHDEAQDNQVEREQNAHTLMMARHRADVLSRQRKKLIDLHLVPSNARSWKTLGPHQRIEDALVIDRLIDDRLAGLDAQLQELMVTISALTREKTRLDLIHQQRSSANDLGDGKPTWRVDIKCSGEGAVDALYVEYVVMAAHWWPLYTLHLSDGGKRASLLMEAMIAQDTQENWPHVRLELSTADLLFDARLPKLPSLKLGKRQPSKPTGFREAPEGTMRLFNAYDEAMKRLDPSVITHTSTMTRDAKPSPPMPSPPIPQSTPMPPSAPMPMAAPAMMAQSLAMDMDTGAFEDDDYELEAGIKLEDQSFARASAPRSRSILPSFGAAMPEKKRASRAPAGGFGGAPPSPPMEEEPQGISPEDQWLHHDGLILASWTSTQRGQLIVRPKLPTSGHGDALAQVSVRAHELKLVNPADSRGKYDHRYETTGLTSIPSDATMHRVDVATAEGDAKLWWRTVPHEEESVYRMAKITNPHDAPLLQGPADIFVEGSFLLNTTIEHIDIGGHMVVGLGVDDQMKVARNSTMDESKGGLINNKTVIEQSVDIEITSGHGFSTRVEVLDRIPITYSDDVDIDINDIIPQAEEYDQEDDGPVIKGGRRWWVNLQPGQTKHVGLTYTVTISAKEELVGGNRRE